MRKSSDSNFKLLLGSGLIALIHFKDKNNFHFP